MPHKWLYSYFILVASLIRASFNYTSLLLPGSKFQNIFCYHEIFCYPWDPWAGTHRCGNLAATKTFKQIILDSTSFYDKNLVSLSYREMDVISPSCKTNEPQWKNNIGTELGQWQNRKHKPQTSAFFCVAATKLLYFPHPTRQIVQYYLAIFICSK